MQPSGGNGSLEHLEAASYAGAYIHTDGTAIQRTHTRIGVVTLPAAWKSGLE